jgi:hypothetical protein
MINRPDEKDQVNIVMKGLLPVYYNRMFASPIMDFKQLCNSGIRIEDTIDNGQLDKREGKIFAHAKKTFGSSSKAPNVQANINAVKPKSILIPMSFLELVLEFILEPAKAESQT